MGPAMSETLTPIIHEVRLPRIERPKWQRDYEVFLRLLPELLKTHRGQYVAIHDGQLVETGEDRVEVVLRVWDRFGYGPMHVGLVAEPPPAPIHIPHYRLYREGNG